MAKTTAVSAKLCPAAVYVLSRVAVLLSILLPVVDADAADERPNLEFFEKRIRPVLVQSCYECHSGRTDEPAGGLRLDSREAIRSGGESGPALVPGQPAASLLIAALRYESLEMPPKNQLPNEVIADFAKWVTLGAPDPRDEPDAAAQTDPWATIVDARRDWWSLQPVQDPPVPRPTGGQQARDWPRSTADCFILAGLQEAGLQPNVRATPRQLIRRLSITLTGLPPTVAEVDQFLDEHALDDLVAYEALVGRLLDSQHFGERWARHWMDVVRYTETHGNEWNYEVHHAWRYRDYLIRAFNSDLPYDQFVREHLAGDLLDSPRWNHQEQFNESLIGTGFYRFGEVNHDDCVSLTSLGYDILDNQIDTLSKAFQATTVACARCHDHKIDSVSMRDYYALLGILKSSRLTAHTLDADSVNAEPLEQLQSIKTEIRRELSEHWASQVDELDRYLLAADAQHRGAADAEEVAVGLDAERLQSWVNAISAKDPTSDQPTWAWSEVAGSTEFAAAWASVSAKFLASQRSNADFNARNFKMFADFRAADNDSWQKSGQGLRGRRSPSGGFTIAREGPHAVASILPAGRFTHELTQKLNGSLRSPVIPGGWKRISAQVLGAKTSAFRLVSNNCQLNYANYRALTSAKPIWVTFEVPRDPEALQTFAELLTKFNNPKFPDPLGTLGGDLANSRFPWAEAAADPHSFFGVLQVVLHNGAESPRPSLTPLAPLFRNSGEVTTRIELAKRYGHAIRAAVSAWAENETSDDDVYWLSWAVDSHLLDHSLSASPRLAELVARYRSIEEQQIRLPRLSPGLSDHGHGWDHRLLERGNFAAPGETVPRRYLGVLNNGQPFAATGSGRLQLANAIASAENPLTARVMVNRVWHYLFGTGIVRTVDDFGRVGELPSHPALLDHLTTRFTRSVTDGGMGWSLKRLIREIVLSETFRMSGVSNAAARSADPQNRLLHHYPTRRMEAEAIRDSILAVSGRLRLDLFGQSLQPFREEANATRRLFAGPLDGNGRRSIYIKVNLMEGPRFLGAFNFPGGKVAQGRRDMTNVPGQALTLLNDRFVLQQARYWAEDMSESNSDSAGERMASMFEQAMGRPPEPHEVQRFVTFVKTQGAARSEIEVWCDVAHVLFNLKEFIYIP